MAAEPAPVVVSTKPVPGLERRLLLPLIGPTVGARTFQAALACARADDAIIRVLRLALVPRHLALDTLDERPAAVAPDLVPHILRAGVRAEAWIQPGRTSRHALAHALDVYYDCIVLGAGGSRCDGFSAADVAWLIPRAPGTIVVLAPSPGEPQLSVL
jgi:hypothetical protein